MVYNDYYRLYKKNKQLIILVQGMADILSFIPDEMQKEL